MPHLGRDACLCGLLAVLCAMLEIGVRDAEAQLSDQEDGFAQNELLEFIHSGKYAHNPLKLANAMAGIRCHTWDGMRAYAGCWQSYARCSKLECAMRKHSLAIRKMGSLRTSYWSSSILASMPTIL